MLADLTIWMQSGPSGIMHALNLLDRRQFRLKAGLHRQPDKDAPLRMRAISAAIVACQGNLTLVAKELRISKSTLYLKVKKYGLDKLVPDARVSAR